MKKLILTTSLLFTVLSLDVFAKQPLSESLVDCATIFSMTTRAFPEHQTEKTAALRSAERVLLQEAGNKARAENRPTPQKYITRLVIEKQKWDARGIQFIFTDEFRDWASYCGSLSKHFGVDLKDIASN